MGRRVMVVGVDVWDLHATLRQLGFEVRATTASGEEALRFADEHRPDSILMDVGGATAAGGLATAALLCRQRAIPIVFVSGPADRATLARAAELDHDGFLITPVSGPQLHATLELACRKREARVFEAEEDTEVRAVAGRCVLVGSTDPELARRAECDPDPLIAKSPLDMIDLIETHGHAIRAIVLVGPGDSSVTNAQLAQFIDATYPWIRVVFEPVGSPRPLTR